MTNPDPTVSVIIVNYRRPNDTLACIDGLRGLDWPNNALEVIIVDNASGDGSAEIIGSAAPEVTVIASATNSGFAGGCNIGAAKATGQYLAFINNDARPDEQWLRAAVDVLEAHGSIACVASRVLDWDGATVDFVDAAMAFYGHGFKLHVGAPAASADDEEHDVLFASGAAMVIDAAVFRDVGGFDESYFMFFEDVDLGWRLWLCGHEVRYVPSSLVYHRHHASMQAIGAWREHYLLERNALFTIYKNYDDAHLARVLPAALALAVRRGIALGSDDAHSLDLSRSASDDSEMQPVHKHTLAGAFAVDAFVEALPALDAARKQVQARRRRPDDEVLRLFRRPLQPNIADPYFTEGFDAAVDAFKIAELFTGRRKVVVATGDTLRPMMAGPAIRAWQIALALSREHDVELVSTTECADLSHPDFVVRHVDAYELHRLVEWCDVVIFQGFIMFENPIVGVSNKVVVVDIYDPFHLEQLEQARDLSKVQRRQVVQSSTDVLNQQLARGDFFTCASAKQRDFWLGQLAAMGRINPLTYDVDETLENLIAVVPFGVSDTPPVHGRSALKGVVPGIGLDDKVVLWGGGIYNWFDPLTLLRAIDKLRARVPEVRLYFLGLKHPNPHVPEMRMAVATQRLSDELGLTGTHVFFNEGWVEYDDRQNYLLEADVGVSTHLDHIETEFSFRTRILDYFWASLPVVATRGDSLADLIESNELGLTVPAEDVDALEEALFVLLTDDATNAACRDRAAAVADRFRWATVLEPLVQFCRQPMRAPDLVDPDMAALLGARPDDRTRRPTFLSWRHDRRVVLAYLRAGDWRTIAHKTMNRVRTLLND
jgi:GT2 family glycosyltransferase/glycosyltransferase involved in cell wall biosynthesis